MTEPTTFRTREPIPEVGAQPGDIIVVAPDDAEKPVTVVRHIDRENAPAYLFGPYLRFLPAAGALVLAGCAIVDPMTELTVVNKTVEGWTDHSRFEEVRVESWKAPSTWCRSGRRV